MSKQFKNGDVITFGRHKDEAIDWYVVSQDDTSYTLFATKPLFISVFGDNNDYKISTLRKATTAILDDFTTYELSKLVENKDYFGDKIYIPTFDAIKELQYKYIIFRFKDILWYWTSSPHPSYYSIALHVGSSGMNNSSNTDNSDGGVRPAVIIKKSKE